MVDDGLNQSKGAKGPDEWMPPNAAFHCEYARMWKQVLETYSDLKLTSSEEEQLKSVLAKC